MNKGIHILNLRGIRNGLSSLMQKIQDEGVPKNHHTHSEIKGQNERRNNKREREARANEI